MKDQNNVLGDVLVEIGKCLMEQGSKLQSEVKTIRKSKKNGKTQEMHVVSEKLGMPIVSDMFPETGEPALPEVPEVPQIPRVPKPPRIQGSTKIDVPGEETKIPPTIPAPPAPRVPRPPSGGILAPELQGVLVKEESGVLRQDGPVPSKSMITMDELNDILNDEYVRFGDNRKPIDDILLKNGYKNISYLPLNQYAKIVQEVQAIPTPKKKKRE